MVDTRLYHWLTAIFLATLLLLFGCGQVFHNKLPRDTNNLIKASKSFILTGKTAGYETGLNVDKGDFYSIIATGNVRKNHGASPLLDPETLLGVVIGDTEQTVPPINATLPARAGGEIGLFLQNNTTRIGAFQKGTKRSDHNNQRVGNFHIIVMVWGTKDVEKISDYFQKTKSLNLDSEQIANLYNQSTKLKTYMADSKAAPKTSMISNEKADDSSLDLQPSSAQPGETSAPEMVIVSTAVQSELPGNTITSSETLGTEDVENASQQEQKAIVDVSKQPSKRDSGLMVETKKKATPLMLIVTPRNDQTITTENTQLIGVIEDYNGLSLIEIRVNGKLLVQEHARGLTVGTPITRNRYEFNQSVPLRPGKNEISIYARNINGGIVQELISLTKSREKTKVHALIVGINSYTHLPQLKYAVRDAEAFRDLVLKRQIVNEENLFFLIEDDANINNLRKVLGTTLKRKAAKEDMVLIYFAGHGATERDAKSPDGDGLEKYLLPINADPNDLYSTAIPMREISYVMNRINAEKLIFIVDSCYSGASGGRTVALEGMRANLSDMFLERLAGAKGRVVIAASGPNEVSVESDQLNHGIFTYHLLEAIRGKADYDEDGFITVDETYRYVSEKVPEATGQAQNPVRKGIVEGQLVLSIVEE